MHDAVLLQALLDAPGIRPHERDAFRSMAARHADGRALSYGQRAWAQDVGARLGLAGVGHVGEAPTSAFEAGRRAMVRGDVSARKLEAEARELDAELRAWSRLVKACGGNARRAQALVLRVKRLPASQRPTMAQLAADPGKWEGGAGRRGR